MTNPTDLKCPQCGAFLPMEDVNVATDVIFCRSCNHVGKFSEMVQEDEDGSVLDQVPSRMKVVKTARGLEVTYRWSKTSELFIVLFSLFWNGIAYGLLFSMLGSNDDGPGEYLTVLGLIVVGMGLLLWAVYALFGRMRLTLKPGRGELFRGVGEFGQRLSFLLEKGARISIEASNTKEYGKRLNMITVEQPSGKPFEFGTGIRGDDAQRYVVVLLRQMRE